MTEAEHAVASSAAATDATAAAAGASSAATLAPKAPQPVADDTSDDDDVASNQFEDAVEEDATMQQTANNAPPHAAENTSTMSEPEAPPPAEPEEELLESKRPVPVAVAAALEEQLETSQPRPATARSSSSSSKPFAPLPASKNWRTMALRSNGKLSRLMQAALLKTLLHAIRRGSAEGVKVAIERGVALQYIDSRNRNLIMCGSCCWLLLDRSVCTVVLLTRCMWCYLFARLAAKCDTDARLQIAVILCDAGCDINHKDQLGWSCLHYAWCAAGYC